jgi:hypothetical protein
MLRSSTLFADVDRMAGIVLLAGRSRYGGCSVAVRRWGLAWDGTGCGECSGGWHGGFADDGVVAGGHGGVICVRGFLVDFTIDVVGVATGHAGGAVGTVGFDLVVFAVEAWVAVEDLEERLVRVVVQVVDLVATGEQVGHGLGWRLVGDGGTDDVGDVAPVLFGWDLELRVRVEAPRCTSPPRIVTRAENFLEKFCSI